MLRRLAMASRKLVEEAIVSFVLIVVVEVNVRWVEDMRKGSLEVDLVKRGETNGFCRRGRRMLLSSVGSSGADIVVVQLGSWLIDHDDGVTMHAGCGSCPR